MGFSDTFTMRVAQACDDIELKYGKDSPKMRAWAQTTKIGQALAALDIATGPNGEVNLLDMVVMVTLKRQSIEEHEIPVALDGKGGEYLLPAYQRSYDEIWSLADRLLDEAQLKELRDLIEQWRRDNPNQYYVGFVRLEDFGAYRQWQNAPQKAKPGSIFSLLYIDPLAGLDPVAIELRAFQGMTARMIFIFQRLPIILQWQGRREIDVALSNSHVSEVVASTSKFADATDRFATAITKYPQQFTQETQALVKSLHDALTAERTAAIEQADKVITAQRDGATEQINKTIATAIEHATKSISGQREALIHDLNDQQTQLGQNIDKLHGLVGQIGKAGESINNVTGQTVSGAEQSTRRLMDHAFLLTVLIIVVIPIIMLVYRLASRRMGVPLRERSAPRAQA